MSRLKQKQIARIKQTGPISVADYMAECLFHPELGYYTQRNPFGEDGDFITAPDISQMFGELCAAWLAQAWQALGAPNPFTLCEIGPGRGTWMADIVRTVQTIAPQMAAAMQIVMIEKSDHLASKQQTLLQHYNAIWVSDIDDLPAQPTLIIANELFDALPMRQYVLTDNGWRERIIALDDNDALIFTAGSSTIDDAILPPNAKSADIGSIFEYAPAREALAQQIAAFVCAHQGAALIIDYGHTKSDLGDTLQAVRNHTYEDIFANPGEADLTSHVDFEALAIAARQAGGKTHKIITQAEFLLALGLVERAGQLGAGKDETKQKQISDAVQRLAGNDKNQMGDLFKVMSITRADAEPLPPFT